MAHGFARGSPARDPLALLKDSKNKLENEFADLLDTRKLVGKILAWYFEPMSLRIGTRGNSSKALFWTPDFMVIDSDYQWIFYEVKGSWRATNHRDARTRIKVAALMFPHLRFVGATQERGVWIYEEFSLGPDEKAVTRGTK